MEGTGDVAGALTILQELYKVNPENLNVIFKIAHNQKELNMLHEAVDSYKKVLFLDPFNKEAKEIIENIEKGKVNETGSPSEPEESVSKPKEDDPQKDLIEFERVDTGSEIRKKIEIGHQEESDLIEQADQNPKDLYLIDDEDIQGKIDVEKTDEEPDDLDKVQAPEPISTPSESEHAEDEKRTEEPPQKIPDYTTDKSGDDEDFGFITESAAKLYEEQELFDEAILIYNKLEDQKKAPGSYSTQIEKIKKKKTSVNLIKKLQDFKEALIKGVQSV